ncbi:MAG TPA: hypothetical protein VJ695_04530 [Nitrososphaera sp.]|nr:hypothetical protein [Nitrososphaera sp.]
MPASSDSEMRSSQGEETNERVVLNHVMQRYDTGHTKNNKVDKTKREWDENTSRNVFLQQPAKCIKTN